MRRPASPLLPLLPLLLLLLLAGPASGSSNPPPPLTVPPPASRGGDPVAQISGGDALRATWYLNCTRAGEPTLALLHVRLDSRSLSTYSVRIDVAWGDGGPVDLEGGAAGAAATSTARAASGQEEEEEEAGSRSGSTSSKTYPHLSTSVLQAIPVRNVYADPGGYDVNMTATVLAGGEGGGGGGGSWPDGLRIDETGWRVQIGRDGCSNDADSVPSPAGGGTGGEGGRSCWARLLLLLASTAALGALL